MEAMILAAGEGTRLRPLTYQRPKALIPFLNTPLLVFTLAYLEKFFFKRIIINGHHLPDQLAHFVELENLKGIFEFALRYEPEIMGTGGGIGLTRDFWRSGDFLVINADILSDVDLKSVREFHQRHGGPVTLVLHDYPLYNQIEVDGQGRIQRFRTGSGKGLAFAGIHFLNREIFGYLPASGSYDIIPVYQAMIDQGIPVRAYVSQGHYWRDLGTPPSYLAAHGEMLTKQRVQASTHSPRNLRGGERDEVETSGAFITQGRRVLIHPEAEVEEGVEYIDWAVAGRGCRLKKGCRIARSVLWENVVLNEGVSVFDSIVGDGVHLEEDIHSRVLV